MGRTKLSGSNNMYIRNASKEKLFAMIDTVGANNFAKILRRQSNYYYLDAWDSTATTSGYVKAIIPLQDNVICYAFIAKFYSNVSTSTLRTCTVKFDPVTHEVLERVCTDYTDIVMINEPMSAGLSGVYRDGHLILTVGTSKSNYYTGDVCTMLFKVEGVTLTRVDTNYYGNSEVPFANYYCQLFESEGVLYQVFNYNNTRIRAVNIENDKLVFSREQTFGNDFSSNSSYVYNYIVFPLSGGRILFCRAEHSVQITAGRINTDGTVTWGDRYALSEGSGYAWAAEVDASHVAVAFASDSNYTSSKVTVVKIDNLTITSDTAVETIQSGITGGGRNCFAFVANGYIHAVATTWKVYAYDASAKKLVLVQQLVLSESGNILKPQSFVLYPRSNMLITCRSCDKLSCSIINDCVSVGEDIATGVTVTQCKYNKQGNVLIYNPVESLNAAYGIKEAVVTSIKNEAIAEVQEGAKNG